MLYSENKKINIHLILYCLVLTLPGWYYSWSYPLGQSEIKYSETRIANKSVYTLSYEVDSVQYNRTLTLPVGTKIERWRYDRYDPSYITFYSPLEFAYLFWTVIASIFSICMWLYLPYKEGFDPVQN